jgi:hypothetical protein
VFDSLKAAANEQFFRWLYIGRSPHVIEQLEQLSEDANYAKFLAEDENGRTFLQLLAGLVLSEIRLKFAIEEYTRKQ